MILRAAICFLFFALGTIFGPAPKWFSNGRVDPPCKESLHSHPMPAIHYAPAENLEKIDVGLIDGAEREIDLAAYVLTDWPMMQALTRAANRGVNVRIYLDGAQLNQREATKAFLDLALTPPVEIRVKSSSKPPMHLKAYQIDGRLLRTGAANLSASGLKQQDNDLVIIESPEAAVKFTRHFEAIWAKGAAWK